MSKRVCFSGNNQSISEIESYYNDTEQSLRMFFSTISPSYMIRFFSYTPSQISIELKERLEELDQTACLSVLSSIEAAFRIDYLQRTYLRTRDKLSVDLRHLHALNGSRASLDDILDIWRNNFPSLKSIISELKSAFNLRHWIAHGRYWKPKFGREYDYQTIYTLALNIFSQITFVS